MKAGSERGRSLMDDPEIDGKPQRPLIERAIETEQIRALGLGPAITARRDSTLEEVVRKLQEQHIGCVLVTGSDGRLEGIFTERDLLSKVALRPIDWSKERVGDYMTPEPETLRLDDHVASALKLMHVGGDPHAPLSHAGGERAGLDWLPVLRHSSRGPFPRPAPRPPPPARAEAC